MPVGDNLAHEGGGRQRARQRLVGGEAHALAHRRLQGVRAIIVDGRARRRCVTFLDALITRRRLSITDERALPTSAYTGKHALIGAQLHKRGGRPQLCADVCVRARAKSISTTESTPRSTYRCTVVYNTLGRAARLPDANCGGGGSTPMLIGRVCHAHWPDDMPFSMSIGRERQRALRIYAQM